MKLLRSLVATVAVLTLAGCHIEEHKNGEKNNVAISTPFGSMKVKTSDGGADTSAIGLTAYPGATPAKEDSDKSNNSADISLSFGDFHLGVKAASFQSSDSSDKIIAFYRKDMARYGDVIECRGNTPVGSPVRTSAGLTCDDKDDHKHVHTSADSNDKDDLQLRAGSPTKQRIVGIKPKDGGIRIGLVMLNLPGDTSDKTAE